ncbi:MAG: phosphatidylglycerophosphatase A [Bryobacteraceae bacterium]|nr:phosphatidylglycerophosphatase A [Bryobacteraceae bacterium]
MIQLARALATWFGCGYFPWGPGTVGSLAALAIAYVLHRYDAWSAPAIALLGIPALIAGVWAAGVVSRETGRKDSQIIVIDEVAGQWITLVGAVALTPVSWIAAFLLFRFFDIVKPWPVRQAEKLPAGMGVMADDVVAGIYAALVLRAAGWFNLY